MNTDEQQAIYDFLSTGTSHLLITALAGTGKTHVLVNAIKSIPQKSVLLTAFNKSAAEELQTRLPTAPKGSVWSVHTFHAAGLNILKRRKGGLEVNARATEELINEAAIGFIADNDVRINFQVRRAATKTLRTLKETCHMPEIEFEQCKLAGETYSHFIDLTDDKDIELACFLTMRAYDLGLYIDDRTQIDFCDMVWLPVVLDLAPPSRYQAVFVDEMQDLSLLQWELIKKLVAPNGRIVGVGDLRQGIYSWRGATGEIVFDEMEKTMNAVKMPLTRTFRCSKAVVREAQRLVPELKEAEPTGLQIGDNAGSVRNVSFDQMIATLEDDDDSFNLGGHAQTSTFVLSRTNADLLNVALDLWLNDVEFTMLGSKEIIEPLIDIVKDKDKSSLQRFVTNITRWAQDEMKRAEKSDSPALADRVEQQYASLMAIVTAVNDPRRIEPALRALSGIQGSMIRLSTVHKAKGLEATRVFILRYTFAQYQERQVGPGQEEFNLEYVAITRARSQLLWVDRARSLAQQFGVNIDAGG